VVSVALRQERVQHVIRDVIGELLSRKIKDPRIGFVSVINVEVTRDMSLAKVFVSVYGTEEAKTKSMEGLRSAQGLIRSEVSKALAMRKAPEILFVLDEGIERSIRVSKLLSDIHKKEIIPEEKEQ
jgi:ribosome-binding factor A